LDAHLRHARAIADGEGLGPRGAVLAFGGAVTRLLSAGEPLALLEFRGKSLVPTGPGSALDDALGQARSLLDGDGEVLLLGGPASAPREVGSVPVVRIPIAPAAVQAGISR